PAAAFSLVDDPGQGAAAADSCTRLHDINTKRACVTTQRVTQAHSGLVHLPDLQDLPSGTGTRSARFIEKPDPTLGLVDPVFEQAGRRHVAIFVAELMDTPHFHREL